LPTLIDILKPAPGKPRSPIHAHFVPTAKKWRSSTGQLEWSLHACGWGDRAAEASWSGFL
jgi:hypothetical protein